MKPYLLLENKEEIKVKNINEDAENLYIIELDNKYLNYFSSQETTIKEIFFKGWFKRSKGILINNDTAPTYNIVNNKLSVIIEAELM